ncbi:hypothetical protein BGX38DRAFT_1159331 [Terfezia claveryi]|nr:hypothetical protein BGX38DRAFT_1159331 [Terfezia claveryi]
MGRGFLGGTALRVSIPTLFLFWISKKYKERILDLYPSCMFCFPVIFFYFFQYLIRSLAG